MIDWNKLEPLIEYEVVALPEEAQIRGNALSSGDEEEDARVENEILEDLENGNNWAWCIVKVTARLDAIELTGTAYMGHCSYKSKAEFIESDDYFSEMKLEAKQDLIDQVNDIYARIASIS